MAHADWAKEEMAKGENAIKEAKAKGENYEESLEGRTRKIYISQRMDDEVRLNRDGRNRTIAVVTLTLVAWALFALGTGSAYRAFTSMSPHAAAVDKKVDCQCKEVALPSSVTVNVNESTPVPPIVPPPAATPHAPAK